MSRLLIIAGLSLLLLGLLWPWLDRLPLGRLPGDLIIRREHVTVYLPFTSMLLASLALSGLWWWFRR